MGDSKKGPQKWPKFLNGRNHNKNVLNQKSLLRCGKYLGSSNIVFCLSLITKVIDEKKFYSVIRIYILSKRE